MDAGRQTHAVDPDLGKRLPGQRTDQVGDDRVPEATPSALRRLTAGPPAALRPAALLSLQRTVGNRAVGRLLERSAQRPPAGPPAVTALAKIVGQEEELAKGPAATNTPPTLAKVVGQEEELAKALPPVASLAVQPTGSGDLAKAMNGGCGAGCGCAHCSAEQDVQVASEEGGGSIDRAVAVAVEQVAPDQQTATAQEQDLAVAHRPAPGLLAKASLNVRSGAAATLPLGGGVYGLTFPESVDVKITARLDKAAGTWSPKVNKLTGHYSMQIRLLPGQTEVTGPSGNTTNANFCDQANNLANLGNLAGNTWYMLKAVEKHEKVHATRFAPGLKAAATAIVAAIEAVTVPTAPTMTKAQAGTALQADAGYQAAVANAQALWLASILTLVAGDHAAGGPTDKAEKTVVEPMRKKICSHAKKKKWPACASCP